jgi:ribosome-binding protein aMBF1 (putative translation factor)
MPQFGRQNEIMFGLLPVVVCDDCADDFDDRSKVKAKSQQAQREQREETKRERVNKTI